MSFLTACGGTANATTMEKEVIFLNRVVNGTDKLPYSTGFTGVFHILAFDEEINPDALYAYKISGVIGGDMEELGELLKEEGFLWVQDYPCDEWVIAGTMEAFERVFLRDEKYKGYYLGADAVTRPDMEDVLKASCEGKIYMETMFSEIWFDKNFEKLIPYLGTDKNRVSVTVTVSTSWEMTEE